MKIPLFSKLTAKSRGRKVVRATAARSMRDTDEDYYETEPNMKLSHAFMVVLILHVVAVGGIYAFNKIKVQRSGDLLTGISGKVSKAVGVAAPAKPDVVAAPAAPATAPAAQPAPSARLTASDADEPLPAVVSNAPTGGAAVAAASVAAPAVTKAQSAPAVVSTKPVAAKTAAADKPASKVDTHAAAGTYKVAKGDNPYTIAKKLGVHYSELLKANGIDDPKKLQIGQVLKVPPKAN